MGSASLAAPPGRRPLRASPIVIILVSLPLLLTLAEAVAWDRRNRSNGVIIADGIEREYLLHVPRSYDAGKPAPLVISLHAGAMWPAAQRDFSQWNELADQEGIIVVYASGSGRTRTRFWNVNRGPGLLQDVRYIADLIDTLRANYNIDAERIYANGLSNGAGMSFVLACTLADRIAAVGLVSAALTLPWEWCQERRPVPMIAFHGTADPITPYNGGRSWLTDVPFRSVPAFVLAWARRNQCTSERRSTAGHGTRLDYGGDGCRAPVTFYTIEGGGHTWPGGNPVPAWFAGPTPRDVDATRLMWEFFREQRLQRNR